MHFNHFLNVFGNIFIYFFIIIFFQKIEKSAERDHQYPHAACPSRPRWGFQGGVSPPQEHQVAQGFFRQQYVLDLNVPLMKHREPKPHLGSTIVFFYYLTALIISLINNVILAVYRLFGLG